MRIEDLRIMVTGAARGMGRHFCLELARQGARVAAVDLDEAGLSALQEEAGARSLSISTYCGSVAEEKDACRLVTQAAEAFSGLNGLINNAGIFRDGMLVKRDKKSGELKKMTLEQWQAVIDVDLTGPFLMTREFAAQMMERDEKPGVIINLSSVSRHGNVGQSNYSAAKAGLVADTKVWALELARYGIRVAAIAPGFIQTPILEGMRTEMLEKMLTGVPLRRLGQPEEILAGVRFIIECDYFTGRCLDIDGGLVM